MPGIVNVTIPAFIGRKIADARSVALIRMFTERNIMRERTVEKYSYQILIIIFIYLLFLILLFYLSSFVFLFGYPSVRKLSKRGAGGS